MGTSFLNVYERFMPMIKDYRLDNLYTKDKNSFYEFLRGFLLNSIDMFDGCLTNLNYNGVVEKDENGNDITNYYFNSTLSSKEIYILCLGLMITWYQNDINDVTQFRLHLNTKDFKTYSENMNMKQRSEILDKMKEDLSNNIISYQLSNLSTIPFFNGGA